MTPPNTTASEPTANEPEESEIRYDLAGNPLPPSPKSTLPKPAAAPPTLGASVHFAPAPSVASPSAAAPPAYTPPPGSSPSYTPPPGPTPLYAPASAAKSPQGPTLYIGLGVGLLLIIGLVFGIRALKPKLVMAPTTYTTYAAIDNSFTCDQPGGWTLHETGATSGNLATATFESGHARVRVVSDATGSVMGDIMGAGNGNLPPAMQVPTVEKLHKMDQKQLADGLPGYKEGEMQKLQSPIGDARFSEWTASGDLHGYRATMLGREREFTVICFCPERNWKVLMPAFQRIISSVKPGSGN